MFKIIQIIFVLYYSMQFPLLVGCSRIKPKVLQLAKYIPGFSLQKLSTIGTVEQIKAQGYAAESHIVETEDGYLLTLHRIPKVSNLTIKGQSEPYPVLLIHGFLQSSADWVINFPPNNSFAFLLSENGYDVWLGNNRGNTYSSAHSEFPVNSHDFWDFSFHEMGKFDMPAMVDYILKVSEAEKVHYVGFSHGAAGLMTGLATRPEYNSKIATGILFGPSVFQDHYVNGFFRTFSTPGRILNAIIKNFGGIPLIPPLVAGILNLFLPIFCNPKVDVFGLCPNFVTLVFGNDGGLITQSDLAFITRFAPSAVGLKGLAHTLQTARSGRFAEYDYGSDNLKVYGLSHPPEYNLSQVKAPISIFVAEHDSLAMEKDAQKLADHLPNLKSFHKVPYKQFHHIDFSYGGNVAADLYWNAIKEMQS